MSQSNNIEFKCPFCNQLFISSQILNDHVFAFHEMDNVMGTDNDEEEDDDDGDNDEEMEEPADNKNKDLFKFPCNVCGKKFATEQSLSNHFNLIHNNYQDQLKLVSNKTSGFPGFEALIAILMLTDIDKFTYDTIKNKVSKDDLACQICDTTFFDQVEVDVTNVIKKDSDNDDKKIASHTYHPYKTLCCNKFICDICVYGRVLYAGLICPFCMKNYEKTTKSKYIYLHEQNNVQIDKSKWQMWRKAKN